MSQNLFDLGERADSLMQAGDFSRAEAAYSHLIAVMEGSDAPDQYLLSKTALGLMMCLLQQRRYPEAAAIFELRFEDIAPGKWLALGVFGLDRRMVSLRDYLVFGIVNAHLYAGSDAPKHERAQDVSRILSEVCAMAAGVLPDVNVTAVNQWKLLLSRIVFREEAVPLVHLEAIQAADLRAGGPLPLRPSHFPPLDVWRRPAETVTVFHPDGTTKVQKCDTRSLSSDPNAVPPSPRRKPWWRFF